jgi:LysM repeat protein
MRIRELIQSKRSDVISETVHDPAIDWNKFKLAFAAHAADRDLHEFGKIDGILFLGLAGDPNSKSILDVKLKAPARIGVADPESGKDLDFYGYEDGSRIAGEYYGTPYFSSVDRQPDPEIRARGYQIRKEYEYQIIINHDYFNQATGQISADLLAHEGIHRGFDILTRIPEIRNAVNPRTQKYLDDLRTVGERIPGLGLEDTGKRDFLEHLLMYSIQVPNQIGTDDMFRSKQEVKMFQTMYKDISLAATAYIKRHPVPKGGFELLRKEVDRLTPDTVEITVKPDAEGKPVIIGKLTPEEIERRNKLIQAGANVDKTGKVVKPATVPPAKLTPAEIEKRNKDIQAGANLDKGGRSLGNYTVKSGDSLSKIGAARGISLPDMIKANPQFKNPNLIYPGDQVIIPKKL